MYISDGANSVAALSDVRISKPAAIVPFEDHAGNGQIFMAVILSVVNLINNCVFMLKSCRLRKAYVNKNMNKSHKISKITFAIVVYH